MAAGIETGHARACRSQRVAGATATRPTARASGAPVTARAGQDVRDPGRSQGVAPGRAVALREGTRSTPSPPPSPEVAEPWLEGARDGSVRDRSGRVYKLATIRGYERRLKLRVLPAIGHSSSMRDAATTCRGSSTPCSVRAGRDARSRIRSTRCGRSIAGRSSGSRSSSIPRSSSRCPRLEGAVTGSPRLKRGATDHGPPRRAPRTVGDGDVRRPATGRAPRAPLVRRRPRAQHRPRRASVG